MDCRECARAELTEAYPVRGRVFLAAVDWLTPEPSPLAGFGAAMRVMMTGRAEPTHYERHRAEYVRTGDSRELQRMLRTVALNGGDRRELPAAAAPARGTPRHRARKPYLR